MGSREGKQSHIASAVEELSAAHTHLRITRKSTILLDDDVTNITAAHSNGVRAVLYQPENEAR